MLDESSGWLETSKGLEKINGIPIIKLQVDFSPKAFNEWHKSLFYGELTITVKNCVKIYKICDYYNDEKLLTQIESFMKEKIRKLNPFEVLDATRNLTIECIERLGSFDAEITERNVKVIRKMKLDNFTVLFNAAACRFKNHKILRLMTIALANVENFREHITGTFQSRAVIYACRAV